MSVNSQTNLKKKDKVGGLTLPNYKKMWYLHKNKHRSINGLETPPSHPQTPYIYSEMTFHKDVKAIQFWRDNLLTNGVGKHVDEWIWPSFYTLYIKTNSDWIKDPKVRAKTIRLRRKTQEKLHDIGFCNVFLDITSKHKEQKINQIK